MVCERQELAVNSMPNTDASRVYKVQVMVEIRSRIHTLLLKDVLPFATPMDI